MKIRVLPAQPFCGQSTISVTLPFLKSSKWSRVAKPQEEKLVQGSESDHLEEYCVGELMDAVASKNVKAFRSAMAALIMNCFEAGEENE